MVSTLSTTTIALLCPPSVLREALVMFLQAMVSATVRTADDASSSAGTLTAASLVLVDEHLFSAELLAAMRGHTEAPIAVLMSRGGDLDLLQLGADAYILTTERPASFAAAIGFVLAGNRYVSPALIADAQAEARWQRQLIERSPAAVHVIQEDRRVYVNLAYASRAAALGWGAGADDQFWEVVDERQRADLQDYVASWFAGHPLASRVKVHLRGPGRADAWVASAVCAICFRGRPAIGVISTDITDAVRTASAFTCALESCHFHVTSTERCQGCLYGFPATESLVRAPEAPAPLLSGPARDGGFERLSAKQLAVLRLVAMGKLNKQIAAELDIQETTVKGYIHRILRILDAPNRTVAALRYRAWERTARP